MHETPAAETAEAVSPETPTPVAAEAAEIVEATEPAGDAPLRLLAERLQGVEEQLGEFHRRAEHRETVIDRLHSENQLLRAGLRSSILAPVVADLLRLYDDLGKEAAGQPDAAVRRMFASFADDTEMILDRCGMEAFFPKPGDRFEPNLHSPTGTVVTEDPSLHNTIESVFAPGFTEREGGRVRRSARARFWQYQERQPENSAEHVAPEESE